MMLGRLIAAYRKSNRISLRELAKDMRIDVNTLWRLENGTVKTCQQWPEILRWVFGK